MSRLKSVLRLQEQIAATIDRYRVEHPGVTVNEVIAALNITRRVHHFARTSFMLRAALDLERIKYRTVSLAELGLVLGDG